MVVKSLYGNSKSESLLKKIEYSKNIAVDETEKKGLGLYAGKYFSAGEDVLRFEGSEILEYPGVHTLQIGLNEHLLVDEPWRYVNHSCNPNCGIKDKTKLVAMKDIQKGEEIVFDYPMTELQFSEMNCLCNSPDCRKKITGFKELPQEFKEKYEGYISEYLLAEE